MKIENQILFELALYRRRAVSKTSPLLLYRFRQWYKPSYLCICMNTCVWTVHLSSVPVPIGVDLYTFVGARATTMLSWAPPKVLWAPTTKVGTGITVPVL